MPDFQQPGRHHWFVAAALSGRTERIRLGIGVSQLPLHNPVGVAEEAATVDIVTNGRLDLGVGRGTWNHNFEGFASRGRNVPPALKKQ